jgi:hypothetical protein
LIQAMSSTNEVDGALEVLEELQAEIENAADFGSERQQRVLGEIGEIRRRLRALPAQEVEPTSLDTLERWALEFEAQHPATAQLVNRLSTLLAGMGI